MYSFSILAFCIGHCILLQCRVGLIDHVIQSDLVYYLYLQTDKGINLFYIVNPYGHHIWDFLYAWSFCILRFVSYRFSFKLSKLEGHACEWINVCEITNAEAHEFLSRIRSRINFLLLNWWFISKASLLIKCPSYPFHVWNTTGRNMVV